MNPFLHILNILIASKQKDMFSLKKILKPNRKARKITLKSTGKSRDKTHSIKYEIIIIFYGPCYT